MHYNEISLQIRTGKYASAHPAVIAAQVRLGEALIAVGDESDAEPILRGALASTHIARFPLLPWQVADAESALAACWMAMGRDEGR